MTRAPYRGFRFPKPIIQHAVWLYARFTLSLRDVEDLLAERGITVSYETIRVWVARFGPQIARHLRRQSAERYVASRRDVREDPRPMDVPLARG
jgi:putative transposase